MSVQRKILVLAETLNVDGSSAGKCNVALVQSLLKANFDLKVFHYSGVSVSLQDINTIPIAEKKFNLLFVLSRFQRLLNRWFSINIGNTIESLFGFSFSFFNDSKSMANALKHENPKDFDMILTLSKGNSYRTHKALLKLPQWHSKWFAYIHDPYPQQLYPRPFDYVPRGYRSKRLFFAEISKKASQIVFPSLLLKDWMQSYFGHIEGKSIIIPHQIDETLKEGQVPPYFDTSKFNILFAGNLLDLRNPDVIVEAYGNFLSRKPEALKTSQLFFIGKMGSFKPYLEEKKTVMPNLYVSENYVPFDEVYAMQNQTSVNVILDAKTEISPFLPGKFPHCVAANKPIMYVGPYYSETKRVLGDTYPHIYDFDVDAISKTFEELFKTWQTHPEKLVLNRKDLENYMKPEFLKSQIETALNS